MCVINSNGRFTKQELEQELFKSGATIVQGPVCRGGTSKGGGGEAAPSKTWCVIAGKRGARVQNIIRDGRWDVVKVSAGCLCAWHWMGGAGCLSGWVVVACNAAKLTARNVVALFGSRDLHSCC